MIKEKELKLALSKEEYNSLLNSKNKIKKILQTNHYFDTKNYDLQNKNITLRIRNEVNRYQLTLKLKMKEINSVVHSNEFNYDITYEEYQQAIKDPHFIMQLLGNEATLFICNTGIDFSHINYLGKIENLRASFEGLDRLNFHLDKTLYPNNNTEYELEIEDIHNVEKSLFELRDIYNIKGKKSASSKYSRFIKYLHIH
ncbi:CYTH domain-containing protein (plasmid) [Bacillus mycoides]|uniref:CYTH domain-containing protein n=1 Tax=Bacillus mycoides TaxID=1405 RepID=UPI003F755FFC